MITTEQISLKKETFILITNLHSQLACSVAVVLWSISKSITEEGTYLLAFRKQWDWVKELGIISPLQNYTQSDLLGLVSSPPISQLSCELTNEVMHQQDQECPHPSPLNCATAFSLWCEITSCTPVCFLSFSIDMSLTAHVAVNLVSQLDLLEGKLENCSSASLCGTWRLFQWRLACELGSWVRKSPL